MPRFGAGFSEAPRTCRKQRDFVTCCSSSQGWLCELRVTWKAQPEKGGLEQLVPVPAESLGGARIYFGLWRGLGLVLLFGLCARWGYHSQAAPGLIFL